MTDTKPWLKTYPPGLKWDADIAAMTMPELMGTVFSKNSEKPCLSFLGRHYSYGETGEMISRFARGLQDMGIGKGARVGLCLPNSPFYVIAYHGILRAGAIAVNFNPLYAPQEIEGQIADSGIETMVTLNVAQIQPKIEKMIGHASLKRIIYCELADVLPPVKGFAFRILNALKGHAEAACIKPDASHVPFARLVSGPLLENPPAIAADDVAVLQYTGGTTGVPKAAQLTHANISANTRQAALWFTAGKAPQGQMSMLAVLPFFHVFSMTVQMNLTLSLGGRLVMLPKFELKPLLKTITREKPTIFAGVPTLYRAITSCPTIDKYDLTSLKLCVSGGAPLPENIRNDFKKLTGLELVEGYGLSETSPLATGNPIEGVKKLNSIGLPVPATDIRIVPLEAGAPEGEIRIKGPQVMKGYWNRPQDTAEAFDEQDYVRTGDVGYMDEDGYIFIVDRIKDMIIASGFKVFPRRVEEDILRHPAVAETIVAGIKDDYRGETVKAWIVRQPGMTVTEDEMRAFLKDKLAPYEMPKFIEFRDSLPKTLIGKPDRKALLAAEKAKKA